MELFNRAHLNFSCYKSTHILSHPGSVSLSNILCTKTYQSSETLLSANRTSYEGWRVAPTAESWSRTSWSLVRKGFMPSPFCIFMHLIFCFLEVPWYSMERASDISLVISLVAICETICSWTPSRIYHFAYAISFLYSLSWSTSLGTATTLAMQAFKPYSSRRKDILSFQMTYWKLRPTYPDL